LDDGLNSTLFARPPSSVRVSRYSYKIDSYDDTRRASGGVRQNSPTVRNRDVGMLIAMEESRMKALAK
jgi:hypothetical protein